MSDVEALHALAVELGREFLRRGWRRRLPSLRAYLLALRHGRFVTNEWTPELLHRIASVVGLAARSTPSCRPLPAMSAAVTWRVERNTHEPLPREPLGLRLQRVLGRVGARGSAVSTVTPAGAMGAFLLVVSSEA